MLHLPTQILAHVCWPEPPQSYFGGQSVDASLCLWGGANLEAGVESSDVNQNQGPDLDAPSPPKPPQPQTKASVSSHIPGFIGLMWHRNVFSSFV